MSLPVPVFDDDGSRNMISTTCRFSYNHVWRVRAEFLSFLSYGIKLIFLMIIFVEGQWFDAMALEIWWWSGEFGKREPSRRLQPHLNHITHFDFKNREKSEMCVINILRQNLIMFKVVGYFLKSIAIACLGCSSVTSCSKTIEQTTTTNSAIPLQFTYYHIIDSQKPQHAYINRSSIGIRTNGGASSLLVAGRIRSQKRLFGWRLASRRDI
jgi:hypothetical protein